MVYSGETGERLVRGGEAAAAAMAVIGEFKRPKPPLHNFDLPCLKWGKQRYLRCIKVPDSFEDRRGDLTSVGGADRRRRNRFPSFNFQSSRSSGIELVNDPTPRIVAGVEEGIDLVREKIMLDLKTAANRMREAILKKELSKDYEKNDDKELHRKRQLTAAEEVRADQEEAPTPVPPWNLRRRRPASKAAIDGDSVPQKELRVEGRKSAVFSSCPSSCCKMSGEKREREKVVKRPKLTVALSRREIEMDFMEMLGQRPPRKPKKRPRKVQEQLDSLFPGLWLSEVTLDTYKVPDLPDNNKKR